jgi:putative CocE/NonD family hydrolase
MRLRNLTIVFLFVILFATGISLVYSNDDYHYKRVRAKLIMSDSIKLDVTYAIPTAKVPNERFPVLMELLPYRKDDSFFIRDAPFFDYFAKKGFVVARVDIRGTGSSDGTLVPFEYSERELQDAEEIIDQLSKMSWSNGNIGVFGKSWSAFNGIMMAFRAGKFGTMPALKAIMALHGSEDLYWNDIHYLDGTAHQDEYMASICHGKQRIGHITNKSQKTDYQKVHLKICLQIEHFMRRDSQGKNN